MGLFSLISQRPWQFTAGSVALLVVVWLIGIAVGAGPANLFGALLGLWGLVVVLVGAIPAIAQWIAESGERLKQNKPLVLTESRASDGTHHQIRNVGGGVAVNVWYVADTDRGTPVLLGMLGPNETKRIDNPTFRYLLIAEARPLSGRRWTPTLNVVVGENVGHAFVILEDSSREMGSVRDFLRQEATALARLWGSNPGDEPTNFSRALEG